MKKIILLIICCLFSAATTVLAQGSGKIFLQHNGTITKIYDNDGISKAIEAAAEGDTLYLSSGNFNGGITINKSIAIIGTSATGSNSSNFTWDGGDAIIQTENEKTISSIYIEGVSFNRSLNFNSNVKAFSAKKCYFSNGINLGNNSSNTEKATIDRCRINCLYMGGQIKDLTCKNSKIENTNGTGGITISSCKIINCNIRSIDTYTKAMFINSIVNTVGNGTDSYLSSQSMLVNTLYHNMNGYDPMQKCSQQDCWSSTETLISDDSNYNCTLTADQLKKAGYLGTDSTVVGCEGGVNPYTLERHVPVITQKGTKVDLDSKKVIINVNVTAK